MQKTVEIINEFGRHKISYKDAKASNQWALIKHLENELTDKVIPNSNSLFHHDKWSPIESENSPEHGDAVRFLGDCLSKFPAAKLLAKMFCYEYGFNQRKGAFSTVAHLSMITNKILTIITSLGVFSANDSDYIVGLNALNDHDLLHIIDQAAIFNHKALSTMQANTSRLEAFFRYCSHNSDRFPGTSFYLEMPWKKLNISLEKWVIQRASDLNIQISDVTGYEALSPDVYMPIINNSLSLIKNIDKTIELNNLCLDAKNKSNNRLTERTKKAIFRNYKDIYKDIYPVQTYCRERDSHNPDTSTGVKDGWVSRLIQHTKTANYQIILLTTGLRVSDLAGLKVGCCVPSGTIDSLYYLVVPRVKKTKNRLHIPVPLSTYEAVKSLEALKITDNEYLFDEIDFKTKKPKKFKNIINKRIRDFAKTFNIPFEPEESSKEFSAHCYRSTVAGFLSEHSNMAILMIRRLFGHSNDIMPSFYQRNNPFFKTQQEKEHEELCRETASMMTKAVSEGKVTGPKGEELKNGYEHFVNNYNEIFPANESQSLTDLELRQSFEEIIYERFIEETACGFLTPLGVICMNNTNNPEPTPCGKRANRNITDTMNESMSEIMDTYSTADPSACIGAACGEAIIGPWSITLQESLAFNKRILKNELGDKYKEQHYIEHAQLFVRTYEPLLKSIGMSGDKQ
jgi:integrase